MGREEEKTNTKGGIRGNRDKKIFLEEYIFYMFGLPKKEKGK